LPKKLSYVLPSCLLVRKKYKNVNQLVTDCYFFEQTWCGLAKRKYEGNSDHDPT